MQILIHWKVMEPITKRGLHATAMHIRCT